MKLKRILSILPSSFLVYDMNHDTIFNVAFYKMLYTPKYEHYLDYHVYLIEPSDRHIVVNVMEDTQCKEM